MPLRKLNQNERLVLCGLTRFPLLNDRELAERLGMNTSTLTAIRHRLYAKGLYRKVRIPLPFPLGVEMLAACFAVYNPSVMQQTYSQSLERMIPGQSEAFWSIRESGQDLTLYMSRNYTSVKRHVEDLEEMYVHGRVILEEVQHLICFPGDLLHNAILFDYSTLLEREFKVTLEGEGTRVRWRNGWGDGVTLTDTEKIVYLNLVRYPEKTDKWISERTGVSRYTIARSKRKFEMNNLLRTVTIPDIKALGFEMLVFAHAKFNLRAGPEERSEMLREVLEIKPPILLLNGKTEAVSIDVYRDFESFRGTVNRLSMIYREHPIFVREPMRIMFSVPNMRVIKDFDFSGFISGVVGVNETKVRRSG